MKVAIGVRERSNVEKSYLTIGANGLKLFSNYCLIFFPNYCLRYLPNYCLIFFPACRHPDHLAISTQFWREILWSAQKVQASLSWGNLIVLIRTIMKSNEKFRITSPSLSWRNLIVLTCAVIPVPPLPPKIPCLWTKLVD